MTFSWPKDRKNRIMLDIVVVLVVLALLLGVFRAGMSFGYRRALYSIRGGENYERNFLGGGHGRGMMAGMNLGFGMGMNINHGAYGTILKIDASTDPSTKGSFLVSIKDQDGSEKSIVIGSSTPVREYMNTISASALKVNDDISAIGSPNNNGQIEARFVRVFPKNPNPSQ